MTIAFDEFNRIQARVNSLQREADQAKGATAQLLADVKKDFGVADLQAMKALHDKLEKQEQRQGEEYAELREQFTDTYGHLLNEEDE